MQTEIKIIRQLASNIKKHGTVRKSEDVITWHEYWIDDICLLASNDEVTMYRTEKPIILLDTVIVTADWLDGEQILNRSSIHKMIDIIKAHKEFKLLDGIE